MAFISNASASAYLRLETSDESFLIDLLITSSLAQIQRYINRPIVATSGSYIVPNDSGYLYRSPTAITLRTYPVDQNTLTITDSAGIVVSSSNYYVQSGMVYCNAGYSFPNGPYTVSVVEGLQTSPNYATEYEPIINLAILDLVAMNFLQRNPDVKTDNQGDISQTYIGQEMPPRTCTLLNLVRIPGIAR